MEIVYFVSALILLTALIYASLNYHYRNKSTRQIADQVVRDRYHRNET